MTWTEISLSVGRDAAPLVERAFFETGALAVTLEDSRDEAVLEPEPGATPLWPTVTVRALYQSGIDRLSVLSALHGVPGADRPGHILLREVEDRDWERAWMERFRPMRFGRRLWIVPGGMSIPPDPENIEIRLDPGLAFGTGTHPTTALCLEWLDARELDSLRVVDFGCGSGVLGIAAVLAGAAGAVCVDKDPQALEATRMNAVRNGVLGRVACCPPDSFSATGVDVVIANILATPLIRLREVLTGCLKPGGSLILSGLLVEQSEAVVAAYEESCTATGSVAREGWLRLDLEKRRSGYGDKTG